MGVVVVVVGSASRKRKTDEVEADGDSEGQSGHASSIYRTALGDAETVLGIDADDADDGEKDEVDKELDELAPHEDLSEKEE